MSCLDSVRNRLTEIDNSFQLEFQSALGASLPGNLQNVFNSYLGSATDAATFFLNQTYASLEELAANVLQETAIALVDMLTFGDALQVALFKRLANTLREYLVNRQTLIQDLRNIVVGLRSLLNEMNPRDYSDIIRIVTQARNKLNVAIEYFKAAERGILSFPPTPYQGFLEGAAFNVDSAKNILGGTPDRNITFEDLIGRAVDFSAIDVGEQYELAARAIVEGVKEIARLISVEIPAAYLISSLSGINFGGLAGGNNIDNYSSKIKSTSQLIVAFPFQITTLNRLLQFSYNKTKRLRQSTEEIRDDITNTLNEVAANPAQYGVLEVSRIPWVVGLNLIYTGTRQDILGGLDEDVSDLIINLNAINDLINYLAEPGRIKNINRPVERIKRTFATMIPSLFSALVNAGAHRRAINYLNDILVNCHITLEEDQKIIDRIDTLNNVDVDNQYVEDAVAALQRLEDRIGYIVGDMWGIGDGTVVARLASVLSPGIISSIGGGLFNIGDNALDNILGEDGLGYEDLNNSLFGGLGNSLSSIVECAEANNTIVSRTQVPLGSDIVDTAEGTTIDVAQNLQNTVQAQTVRQDNNSLITENFDDISTDAVLMAPLYEDGVA